MRLEELLPHEQLALAGMIRMLVRMDGELSEEEAAALAGLAQSVGPVAFWERMREAQEKLGTPELVTGSAMRISRPEVRDWIYGLLVGLAAADGIDVSESSFLDWLMRAWDLR